MASSLFQKPMQNLQNNPMMQMLQNNPMMQMLQNIRSTGNPQAMAQQLMNQNPQFRLFYEANKNKPIDQIAKENGIDINQLKQMLGK